MPFLFYISLIFSCFDSFKCFSKYNTLASPLRQFIIPRPEPKHTLESLASLQFCTCFQLSGSSQPLQACLEREGLRCPEFFPQPLASNLSYTYFTSVTERTLPG